MDRNIRYTALQEEREDDENEEPVSSSATTDNCSVHATERAGLTSFLQTSEAAPGVGSSNPAFSDDSALLPPAYEEVSRERQPEGAGYEQQQQQEVAVTRATPADAKANQMALGDPSTVGLPPSYAVATDLPSYEEAERLKRQEEEEEGEERILDGCRIHPSFFHHHNLRSLADEEHIHMEEGSDQMVSTTDRLNGPGMTVGTDWIFFCTFVMSFLFNWLGFLMSLCITNTVAGRCGALAGLGLSMVKWVAIVKHSGFAGDLAAGESWFWWILMLCGFLLFIRGCMQYVNVKYEWKRITGRLHHFYLF